MTLPLISVVIPAYNHERFVGAAVESVLQQTCSDLELIVVDDGSSDNTAEVVQGYTDSRLQYYYQENQDAYNTINRGISMARGRYISILNSDDVYTADRLEKLVSICIEEDEVCAFSGVIPIDEDDAELTEPELWWNVWYKTNLDFYAGCRDLQTAFLKGNLMVTTSNLFMTAEAAETVGNFSALRYLHDYDFILRMLRAFPGQVHYLDDQKLVYYRIHGGNTLSEAAITGREQDMMLIKKYMLAVIPDEYRRYVEAGSDRLVELERELHEVRLQIHPSQAQGVRLALRNLNQSAKLWLKKKLT